MQAINSWGSPVLLLGFIVLLVAFGGLFSWLKTRAEQATLREAIRSGQPIDPEALRMIGEQPRDRRAGLLTGGLVTIAVALALVVFGLVVGRTEGDPSVFPIMAAIAGFPGLVGIALLIAARSARTD